jgi:proline racemase
VANMCRRLIEVSIRYTHVKRGNAAADPRHPNISAHLIILTQSSHVLMSGGGTIQLGRAVFASATGPVARARTVNLRETMY